MPLSKFLTSVHAGTKAFQSARDLYRDRLAPDFSPFQFIDGRETQLSEILAWVLDPAGSHGQGERFLTAFLEHMGSPWDELPAAEAAVQTEALTHFIDWPNRRIDILVTRGTDWTFAIENKPWAGDQQYQVRDYLDHLDELGGSHRCLIYLSGPGAEPSEDSIASDDRERRMQAGELHLWSYEDLVPWLEACRGVCGADRVTVFLDEFIRYIQKTFMGVRDVTERQQTIETVLQSPENIDAAMQVLAAGKDVRQVLLKQLVEQVAQACPKSWTVHESIKDDRWPRIEIDYSKNLDFTFTFEFDTSKGVYNPVVWGLRKRDVSLEVPKEVNTAVSRILGKGGLTEWWPWRRFALAKDQHFPIEGDWEAASLPWVMIARGEMHLQLLKAAQAVNGALVEQKILTAGSTASTVRQVL